MLLFLIILLRIASLFDFNIIGWHKSKYSFFAFPPIEIAQTLYLIDDIALNGLYFDNLLGQVNIFGEQGRGRPCDLLLANIEGHFEVVGEIWYIRIGDLDGELVGSACGLKFYVRHIS